MQSAVGDSHKLPGDQAALRRMQITLLSFAILIVATGIAFRFWNLEHKIFWYDETATAMHACGFSERQIFADTNGKVMTAQSFLEYEKIDPSKGIADVIGTSAEDDPHIPPLYYLILHAWVHLFGDSLSAWRTLSVTASLAILPIAYLLCKELFNDRDTGIVAVTLLAVSPMYIIYAQEARCYSFVCCATLLSTLLLLRAMRLQSAVAWIGYAASCLAGLYFQPLFMFVLTSHIMYALARRILHKEQFSMRPLFLSAAAAILLFLPWLAVMLTGWKTMSTNMDWVSYRINPGIWLKTSVLNVGRLFYDMDAAVFPQNEALAALVVGIIAFGLWTFCRLPQQRAVTLLFAVMVIPSLPLIGIDIVLGGTRATVARYFLPGYSALIIAWSNAFVTQVRSSSVERPFWIMLLISLLVSGICSSWQSDRAFYWWNKVADQYTPLIAQYVNRQPDPVILVSHTPEDHSLLDLLVICRLLRPQVEIIATSPHVVPEISDSHRQPIQLLLYRPDPSFLHLAEQKYHCGFKRVLFINDILLQAENPHL